MDKIDNIANQLAEINTKLDHKFERIDTRLGVIEKTAAVQGEQLKDHIRRTELAEENLDLLRKDFKPVKKHVDFVNQLSKLVLALLGVAAAVAALTKYL